MFYRQFLKITNALDEHFVNEFDFWLASVSKKDARTISVSTIASRFDVKYSVVDAIVKFAEKEGILKRRYVVICDNEECEFFQGDYDANELIDILGTTVYCHNCGNEFIVSYENTLVVYSKEKEPNVPEALIKKEIEKRLGHNKEEEMGNFIAADLLANHLNAIYDLYYSPDESAYDNLKCLKAELNGPFKTSKEKGDALERLTLYLFKQIRGVSGTNKIRTFTNQFDCTIRFPQSCEVFPTIMKCMTPYFIIECKNEMDKSGEGKTPSNTYFHKLSDIMSLNDAQIGIVISRGEASDEDTLIAYHNYLACRSSKRQKIVLSISDNDLDVIVDKRVNLLEYLSYKMDMLTMNAKNPTFEMFEKTKN